MASLAMLVWVSGCIPPATCEGNCVAPQLRPLPVVGSRKEMPLHQPTAASGGAHPPKFSKVEGGQFRVSSTVLAQPSVKKTATSITFAPGATVTLLIWDCPLSSPPCE